MRAWKRRKPICRCGVWEYAHREGRGCGNFRKASWLRAWLNEHSVSDHIKAHVWTRLPLKFRWRVVDAVKTRHPEWCWCDLVMAALSYDTKEFRRGGICGCGVSTPWNADRSPEPGLCYCQPPRVLSPGVTEEGRADG